MPEIKAKCPVCGMDVERDTRLKTDYKGHSYYFCSERDKKKFLERPEAFAGKEHVSKTGKAA